jgi:hypothetical protein
MTFLLNLAALTGAKKINGTTFLRRIGMPIQSVRQAGEGGVHFPMGRRTVDQDGLTNVNLFGIGIWIT